jgi:succinate dehydrogenase/fumarate reductase-like Fe-S protein
LPTCPRQARVDGQRSTSYVAYLSWIYIDKGGLQECGNSQNCVRSCPKGIPLMTAIAVANREATKHKLKKWFSF